MAKLGLQAPPASGLADVHRHLDGSLRRATLDELAARAGVPVPIDLGGQERIVRAQARAHPGVEPPGERVRRRARGAPTGRRHSRNGRRSPAGRHCVRTRGRIPAKTMDAVKQNKSDA